MPRRVLDVGQCSADHWRIAQMLNENFDVEITRADSHDQAIQLASEGPFDLILINRLLDADGSPGMQVLKTLKTNAGTEEIPVMLVSNFADSQEAAVQAGAIPGFGKASLNQPATIEAMRSYLAD